MQVTDMHGDLNSVVAIKALPLKHLQLHSHQAASTHIQVVHNPTDLRQFFSSPITSLNNNNTQLKLPSPPPSASSLT